MNLNLKNGKSRKNLKEFLQFLEKKEAFQKDILSEEDLTHLHSWLEEGKEALKDSAKSPEDLQKILTRLQRSAARLFPSSPHDTWREWTEVLLVAAVVAIGFKTYIYQPFKIPTHSMKPTLYGIYTEPLDPEIKQPNPVLRLLHFTLLGKGHHRIVAKNSGVIQSIREGRILRVLPLKTTTVNIGGVFHTVWTSRQAFSEGTDQKDLLGKFVEKGEVVANYTTQVGDHLFVNKYSYHFRKPKQGEVFVFTTSGITGIERRNRGQGITWGQFYIKRCVGVPGVTLRIEEPFLYSDGEILKPYPIFNRIYSMKNGYSGYLYGPKNGYLTGPASVQPLREDQYWAMGDNSPNSWDSRAWGPVPRENCLGSGGFVYWPFTKRWGFVR